jgi:hypothetical protein
MLTHCFLQYGGNGLVTASPLDMPSIVSMCLDGNRLRTTGRDRLSLEFTPNCSRLTGEHEQCVEAIWPLFPQAFKTMAKTQQGDWTMST